MSKLKSLHDRPLIQPSDIAMRTRTTSSTADGLDDDHVRLNRIVVINPDAATKSPSIDEDAIAGDVFSESGTAKTEDVAAKFIESFGGPASGLFG